MAPHITLQPGVPYCAGIIFAHFLWRVQCHWLSAEHPLLCYLYHSLGTMGHHNNQSWHVVHCPQLHPDQTHYAITFRFHSMAVLILHSGTLCSWKTGIFGRFQMIFRLEMVCIWWQFFQGKLEKHHTLGQLWSSIFAPNWTRSRFSGTDEERPCLTLSAPRFWRRNAMCVGYYIHIAHEE